MNRFLIIWGAFGWLIGLYSIYKFGETVSMLDITFQTLTNSNELNQDMHDEIRKLRDENERLKRLEIVKKD